MLQQGLSPKVDIGIGIVSSILEQHLAATPQQEIFVIIDERLLPLHAKLVSPVLQLPASHLITVHALEANKQPQVVLRWAEQLAKQQASREALIIAIGGGMILDQAAFLASIYKRGIDFWLVPTTLLAMVDAAIGGKTAVNFCGIKNLLGSFAQAQKVVCDLHFLQTLPYNELLSGYAELLKHALLQSEKAWQQASLLPLDCTFSPLWEEAVRLSIQYKRSVVANDPYDNNTRQFLNLGHTFGHAFEAFFSQSDMHPPFSHGIFVAAGIICDLYVSQQRLALPPHILQQYKSLYQTLFPRLELTEANFSELWQLMLHDKKNKGHNPNEVYTVGLSHVGSPSLITVTQVEARQAFLFLLSL